MISMDLKIINKRDNPLLSRIEIEAEANFSNEPTPKKEDIKKKIVSSEKADEKLVVVKNINGSFGAGKAKVSVYIYSSEDELKAVEPTKKDKKAKEAAPKSEGAEAPKKEAKAEEKPAEEKKEEPKAEKPAEGKKEESK